MGPVSRKMLSERQLSSSLFPRLSSSSSSPALKLSCAGFTSERQQKVSVLRLHVSSAFNKQSRGPTGRWEKASVSVIWCNAPTSAFMFFKKKISELPNQRSKLK